MWSAYTCTWAQVLILLRTLELVSHWRGEGSGRKTTVMNNGDKQKQRMTLDN